jgi:uncharacterized membrane protein
MKHPWEDILKERLSTILDGLLGMALGLSAYSLTGFSIKDLQDIVKSLIYFTILFLLTIYFWQGISRSLALARYDMRISFINFILGALLVIMPFCLRLILSPQPETKNFGYYLFPIVISILSFLGALVHILVLRQNIIIPKDELIRMRAMVWGLLANFTIFSLSLLIPPEKTINGYLPQITSYLPLFLSQLPMRIWVWILAFPLSWMIEDGLEHGGRLLTSSQEDESSNLLKSKIALTQKIKAMTNSIFAMSIGLCAYSLTDFAIGRGEDIMIAMVYFAFTFFVIIIFWGEIFRVFAAVLYYDDILLTITIFLTYSITLLPFFFQLVLSSDSQVARFGMTLFPVFMGSAAILNSSLFIIALKRRFFEIPKDDILEMKRAAYGGPLMAIVFILSLWIPTTATIQSHIPQFAKYLDFIPEYFPLRMLSWWFALVALFIGGGIVELITEKIFR